MNRRCGHCNFHALTSDNSPGKTNAFWQVIRHVNEAHPEQTFLCPRRIEGGVGARLMDGHRDIWNVEPNGDKTCSYCGSLSEADFYQILESYVAGKVGYRFTTTDKGYKVYAQRPGVRNAGDGGIKFYLQHVDVNHPEFAKLSKLFDQAKAREREQFANLYRT